METERYGCLQMNVKIEFEVQVVSNRPIISFDGFHFQSFVLQATATILAFSVIFIGLKSMARSSLKLNSVL